MIFLNPLHPLFPLDWQPHHHHCPLILHALQTDASTKRLHHHLADVETESASRRIDFMDVGSTEEVLEKMLLFALGNTDARIRNDNLRDAACFLESDGDVSAGTRILYGVAQDILHNDGKQCGIGMHFHRLTGCME